MKFYWNNTIDTIFTLQENPALQDFKDVKFSVSFGVISLLQKANIGSGKSLYFGWYKKGGCNNFPILEKKHRKKVTSSIPDVNHIQMAIKWQGFDLSDVFFLAVKMFK